MNEHRVVLDTGVIVSAALLPVSVPRSAVDLALDRACVLFSEPTLSEVVDVLRRRKFDRYVSQQRRLEFLAILLREAKIIAVSRRIRRCRDPKDDKFLELAADGRATHIISGDDDLLVLDPFEDIAILTPTEFLARIGIELD
jgi:putative PIN family toxin of toxin-antitoxin system